MMGRKILSYALETSVKVNYDNGEGREIPIAGPYHVFDGSFENDDIREMFKKVFMDTGVQWIQHCERLGDFVYKGAMTDEIVELTESENERRRGT